MSRVLLSRCTQLTVTDVLRSLPFRSAARRLGFAHALLALVLAAPVVAPAADGLQPTNQPAVLAPVIAKPSGNWRARVPGKMPIVGAPTAAGTGLLKQLPAATDAPSAPALTSPATKPEPTPAAVDNSAADKAQTIKSKPATAETKTAEPTPVTAEPGLLSPQEERPLDEPALASPLTPDAELKPAKPAAQPSAEPTVAEPAQPNGDAPSELETHSDGEPLPLSKPMAETNAERPTPAKPSEEAATKEPAEEPAEAPVPADEEPTADAKLEDLKQSVATPAERPVVEFPVAPRIFASSKSKAPAAADVPTPFAEPEPVPVAAKREPKSSRNSRAKAKIAEFQAQEGTATEAAPLDDEAGTSPDDTEPAIVWGKRNAAPSGETQPAFEPIPEMSVEAQVVDDFDREPPQIPVRMAERPAAPSAITPRSTAPLHVAERPMSPTAPRMAAPKTAPKPTAPKPAAAKPAAPNTTAPKPSFNRNTSPKPQSFRATPPRPPRTIISSHPDEA